MEIEKCFNCDRQIGRLEQAHVYKGNVVCQGCLNLLNNTASAKTTASSSHAQIDNVVTTERTSKKWKLLMLVGFLTLIAGIIMIGIEIQSAGEWSVLLGILMIVFAKIASWWCHG
jgi:hypothetical protein